MPNYLEFYRGVPNVGERPLVAQTCDNCGHLLGAASYKRTHRNTWPRTCATCISRRYRAKKGTVVDAKASERRSQLQQETVPKASNYNKYWTLKDLDRVVEMLNEGKTHREIAVAFGRTLYSIQGTIQRFGLSKGWPAREEWLIRIEAYEKHASK